MQPKLLLLICMLCFVHCRKVIAQVVVLNGDLEKINPKTKLPQGWGFNELNTVNYDFNVDSSIVQHGKYAVSIVSKNADSEFAGIGTFIPYNFAGHQLQLKGFIKTENVSGFAGFYLQVIGTRAFDNMQTQQIKGTNDWKEYTFTLPYDSESAKGIGLGALLMGRGKMWFDNICVYIDGQPIETAPQQKIEITKAQQDTAFSKTSGIKLTGVSKQQVQNLTLLAQVWGFIKYHHPAVAKGNVNMDAELFRVMPSVIKARNKKEASDAIEQWIDKLGVPKSCPDCKPYVDKDIAQRPDYGEIFDRNIVSASLANKLTYILNNRNTGNNYYIGLMKNIGNPDFKNEISYAAMAYPDAGYRLLCLYRYWNMIQYFYPYKHLIGKNWNSILPAFIPRFIEAKDATGYDLTTMALISSIHDTHANIWSAPKALEDYRGKYAPPFQAKFVEGKLLVTAYYNDTLEIKNKIKIGDVITTINGLSVDELIKKYLPVTAASNYAAQLRDMPRNYLLRSNNPRFEFSVLRDGKATPISVDGIKFGSINFLGVSYKGPGYHLIDDQIGYLFPGKYYNKDLPAIKKMFKDTKGMIIDMRCYPSEFMPFTFVPYIKSGYAKFVRFTNGSITDPGLFTIVQPLGIGPANDYKGKVVVIVNEETQSQAEYTTMAFQSSPNVTVIGSTTAGADGNVSSIILPGGISTMISGIGILYPDGTETQRKGVKIDERIEPTIAGIKAGRDELLERAKAIIMQ